METEGTGRQQKTKDKERKKDLVGVEKEAGKKMKNRKGKY